ncbi:hypothetical protein B484DRAFT_455747 [Ochromonadaceae sp. CCMP2298]|nr:hypothetical protein B484DRAFT_455747 [Ochromonadaceae sp. CCMP2298]
MSSGLSPSRKASHSPHKFRSPSRAQSDPDLGVKSDGDDSDFSGSPSKRGRSPSKKGSRSGSPSRKGRSKSPRSKSPRSKSPGKFGSKDFEHKRLSADAAQRRQNAIAKVRGLAVEPSDWTRTELLERLKVFAKFSLDTKSGSGTLSVQDKRMLSEDVQVLLEVMRRFTEIQSITLVGCSLTDEALAQISVGLGGLRHLKHLDLRSNLLTKASVDLVCRTFARLSRKLVVLDMQLNHLSFQDGTALHAGFAQSVQELNGMPTAQMATDQLSVLSLPDKALRQAELGIVCALIPGLVRLHSLDLSHNRIEAQGLLSLVQVLRKTNKVHSLDLSHNPLTNGGDFSGLHELLLYAKGDTLLTQVKLEGVTFPSAQKEQQLELSLMANRSVCRQKKDGYFFNEFARDLIKRKAPPRRVLAATLWEGGVSKLDVGFIKLNHVKQPQVDLALARDTASGRDEIHIRKPAAPSRNIIEF